MADALNTGKILLCLLRATIALPPFDDKAPVSGLVYLLIQRRGGSAAWLFARRANRRLNIMSAHAAIQLGFLCVLFLVTSSARVKQTRTLKRFWLS